MSAITVEINAAQLADVRERLAHIKNGTERAMARALNRTASKAKTAASRAVRDQVNLSAAYVRQNLKGPADGWAFKATIGRLSARLSTPKRGILLRNFVTNAVPPGPGRPPVPIRVKVKAAGATEVLSSGFYIRTKTSNAITPAVSNDVLRSLGMKQKLDSGPYTVLHGPSLSQVFTDVKDDISDGMSALLAANLQHEMEWLLNKYPPPGDDGASEG